MVSAFYFPKPSERLGVERRAAPRSSVVRVENTCKKERAWHLLLGLPVWEMATQKRMREHGEAHTPLLDVTRMCEFIRSEVDFRDGSWTEISRRGQVDPGIRRRVEAKFLLQGKMQWRGALLPFIPSSILQRTPTYVPERSSTGAGWPCINIWQPVDTTRWRCFSQWKKQVEDSGLNTIFKKLIHFFSLIPSLNTWGPRSPHREVGRGMSELGHTQHPQQGTELGGGVKEQGTNITVGGREERFALNLRLKF